MTEAITIPKPVTGAAGHAVLVALAAKADISIGTLVSFIAGATPKQVRTRKGYAWLVRYGYLPKPAASDPNADADVSAS